MEKLKIEEMNRLSVSQFEAAPKLPLAVVLDNVRSALNVGSIFRTSDAFRISHIYLCGYTPQPPSAEIHKTALGAEQSVSWSHEYDTCELLKNLRADGYILLALEQAHGSISLDAYDFSSVGRKFALVLGNEVKGVSQSAVDLCDACLEIPQIGIKHSLNVSVSAGIALWQAFIALREKLV